MPNEPSDDPTPAEPTASDLAEPAEVPAAPDPAEPPPEEPVVDETPAPVEEVAVEAEPAAMKPLPLRGTARPEPPAQRAHRDPFAEAHEALERAAAARGAEFTPIPPARRHPLEAAQDALEKARSAREHASSGGTAGLAREANARAQLAELKRSGPSPSTHAPAPREPGDPPSSSDSEKPTSRKRRL